MRTIIERDGSTAVNAADPKGYIALYHPARSIEAKAIDAIDMLIEAGADIEAKSDIGSTHLHSSATVSSVEATLALLRQGANVDSMTRMYETPFPWGGEFAGTPGSSATVDVLLRWAADETMEDRSYDKPMDLLGDRAEAEDFVEEEFELVEMLPERAPVERIWRRRDVRNTAASGRGAGIHRRGDRQTRGFEGLDYAFNLRHLGHEMRRPVKRPAP